MPDTIYKAPSRKPTIWKTALTMVFGISAIALPFLASRVTLSARLMENEDFAANFRDGQFFGLHKTHHNKFSRAISSSNLAELPEILKTQRTLGQTVATQLKNGGVTRLEAMKNLSLLQGVAGIALVSVGVVLLGSILRPHKKSTQGLYTQSKSNSENITQPETLYRHRFANREDASVSR